MLVPLAAAAHELGYNRLSQWLLSVIVKAVQEGHGEAVGVPSYTPETARVLHQAFREYVAPDSVEREYINRVWGIRM